LTASACAAAPRRRRRACISWRRSARRWAAWSASCGVEPGSNKITAALALLKTLPLAGSIITGDAIFTQKEVCRVIVDGGGCVFTVKENQPTLRADIALAFGNASPLSTPLGAVVSPA